MEEHTRLVTAARNGDTCAYEKLIERFESMAYATAYRHLGDAHQAQDAVQDALLEAFMHLHQLQEPAAFPGWFRQIVFRQCTRILRRTTTRGTTLSTDTPLLLERDELDRYGQNIEQLAMEREIQSDVRQAIQALPENERQAIALFYFSDYSQDELSRMLNVPVTTVKKRLYSARQRLKKRLYGLFHENTASGTRAKDASANNVNDRGVKDPKYYAGKGLEHHVVPKSGADHARVWLRAARLVHYRYRTEKARRYFIVR